VIKQPFSPLFSLHALLRNHFLRPPHNQPNYQNTPQKTEIQASPKTFSRMTSRILQTLCTPENRKKARKCGFSEIRWIDRPKSGRFTSEQKHRGICANPIVHPHPQCS
jgi:hypothetical protein